MARLKEPQGNFGENTARGKEPPRLRLARRKPWAIRNLQGSQIRSDGINGGILTGMPGTRLLPEFQARWESSKLVPVRRSLAVTLKRPRQQSSTRSTINQEPRPSTGRRAQIFKSSSKVSIANRAIRCGSTRRHRLFCRATPCLDPGRLWLVPGSRRGGHWLPQPVLSERPRNPASPRSANRVNITGCIDAPIP